MKAHSPHPMRLSLSSASKGVRGFDHTTFGRERRCFRVRCCLYLQQSDGECYYFAAPSGCNRKEQ